jgi:radical SAM protein with 4Fe4S-binding SPASM domain
MNSSKASGKIPNSKASITEGYIFGAEKRGQPLNHFIWSCTRAYPVKHAYSLGNGKPLPDELTTNEAEMLFKKAADIGVDNFFLTGAGWTGEPLMRKDFLTLIHYLSEYKIPAYVKVTGWHFDRTVAKALSDAGCKAIINLTGPREVDILLRGEGAFEDTVNAAELCKEYGVPFGLSVLNTKYIIKQVAPLVNFAISLGARGFDLASLIPQPICVEDQLRVLGPLEPTPEDRENQLNEIYELKKKVGNQIFIVPYEMFNNRVLKTKEPSLQLRTMCSMCDNLTKYEWLEILEDGKAYACAPLKLAFGDIRKDSVKEIMDRMRSSKEIAQFADRGNLKGKCGACEFKGICGGCRARAFIFSGDALNQDPACVYKPKKWRT